jgi:hypothetical protein
VHAASAVFDSVLQPFNQPFNQATKQLNHLVLRMQDLSNMMWALATLGISPDPAWLQQHLREVGRRQAQRSLLPQHLANIGWALAKLSHRPDRDWLARYQEDVLGALPGFKPQEISNVLWALAVLNCKAEQVGWG